MELEQTSNSLEAAAGRWKRLEGRGETKRADRVAEEICKALEPLIQQLATPHLERDSSISPAILMHEGHVAVIKALERYKAEAPASFFTFVRTVIFRSLKHYVRDECGGVISDPAGVYSTRPRVAKAIESLEAQGIEPTDEAIAEIVGASADRIEYIRQTEATTQGIQRLSNSNELGPGEIAIDDISAVVSSEHWLPDLCTRLSLEQPFAHLPQKLKDVIDCRFFQRMTLQETSDFLAVPLPTVKGREKQALDRLRRVMEYGDALEAESPATRRLLTEENINRLPDPHKTVLLQYYHEAKSPEAIAKMFPGLTANNVIDIRRRALETLQRQCQQQEKKP